MAVDSFVAFWAIEVVWFGFDPFWFEAAWAALSDKTKAAEIERTLSFIRLLIQ